MGEHTKGRLTVDAVCSENLVDLILAKSRPGNGNPELIATCWDDANEPELTPLAFPISSAEAAANARRLAAAWNLCEGAPTDALEKISDVGRLILEHAELVAALVNILNSQPGGVIESNYRVEARALLARVKEKRP